MIINTSKLRKEYTVADMSYLDSADASVLYKHIADIIKHHNLTGVVDVGCRTGTINEYLVDHTYEYYGFDTSIEPIEFAKQKYNNCQFAVGSWDELLQPSFEVDVLVFGSVLIYDKNPIGMFERICAFYKPKHAIIHEVTNKNKEALNYTNLSYFYANYNVVSTTDFSLNIPVGERTILDVEYRKLSN